MCLSRHDSFDISQHMPTSTCFISFVRICLPVLAPAGGMLSWHIGPRLYLEQIKVISNGPLWHGHYVIEYINLFSCAKCIFWVSQLCWADRNQANPGFGASATVLCLLNNHSSQQTVWCLQMNKLRTAYYVNVSIGSVSPNELMHWCNVC
jgi:hypothetical protein